jgi:membrane-associated phospholipid phosphatase
MGTVALLKAATSRARPRQSDNPNLWFKGRGYRSFPSDEVALATAVTTSFIQEYRRDHPGVWTLALIPAYVGVARMKSQAHWQTDVLASVGIGAAASFLAARPDRPCS